MKKASDTDGMNHLSDALNSFRCCLDSDIEHFLRANAIDFSRRNWCSVYLIVDENEFDCGVLKVVAYFTLSHKSLTPAESTSKSKIKTVSGLKAPESIPFVLIGQLGKHMEYSENGKVAAADISSREILDYAFEIINASNELIPCRCALVECSDNPKVQKSYTDYGFTFFQNDGGHNQFYKRI